ncbi:MULTISPECIES: hypothetical protein [Photobacterium]|uniref:Uncharacterized protein n=1 Tax=Photobacterium piscicola TaxID=1378299 RepID=A0A1T5I230_9GAMM|nr:MULTISPECIES: hypothetical protein [Photobacterium]SKC33091.1 hypothetical protein CZ809_02626 [Photobacterium piscicola]
MFDFIKRMFGAEPEATTTERQDQENSDQEHRNDKYRQGAPSDNSDGES